MLAAALGDFEHREHVVVRDRAFELDPRSATSYDLSLNELVAQKYGISVDRARSINDRLEAQAFTWQMTWALQDAKVTNSFDAHRLITLAQSQGQGDQMNERLFRAYFSEGRHVGDHDTLSTLAADVGVIGADDLWRGDEYSLDVRRDEREAQELGISGVPAMLLDGTFMVVGPRAPTRYSTRCAGRGLGAARLSLRSRLAPRRPWRRSGPRQDS
jgi:predicted DsbA family dithiol-disulfide isomerase